VAESGRTRTSGFRPEAVDVPSRNQSAGKRSRVSSLRSAGVVDAAIQAQMVQPGPSDEQATSDADAKAAAAQAAADAAVAAANVAMLASSVPVSNSPTFYGDPCTYDCSGHDAGYEWAEDNEIEDPDDCGGNSQSFIEGCESYAEERQEEARAREEEEEEARAREEAEEAESDEYEDDY
jgi:hypothetical protein